MMIYFGKHPRAKAPLIMGHEFSGVIEEIEDGFVFSKGDHVVIETTLSCGECEACTEGQNHVCRTLRIIGVDLDDGFAEYAKVPIRNIHKVPENTSNEAAALAEPLAVAVHTFRRSNAKVGDTVAILGAGPIGLLIGQVAQQAGASQVFISDISPYRIKKAKEMGFHVIDAKKENVVTKIQSETNGVGVDVVFEVAGTQITTNQMVNIAKIQGQIVVVSVFKDAPTVDLATMHFREISLTTTRCYSTNDFKKAIMLMEQNKVDVKSLISHQIPIENIDEGFRLMENTEESLKILIQPGGLQ